MLFDGDAGLANGGVLLKELHRRQECRWHSGCGGRQVVRSRPVRAEQRRVGMRATRRRPVAQRRSGRAERFLVVFGRPPQRFVTVVPTATAVRRAAAVNDTTAAVFKVVATARAIDDHRHVVFYRTVRFYPGFHVFIVVVIVEDAAVVVIVVDGRYRLTRQPVQHLVQAFTLFMLHHHRTGDVIIVVVVRDQQMIVVGLVDRRPARPVCRRLHVHLSHSHSCS